MGEVICFKGDGTNYKGEDTPFTGEKNSGKYLEVSV
jgi:hypothetical protein